MTSSDARVFQLGLALFVGVLRAHRAVRLRRCVIAGRFIQGAAGATILACGLSLLSVANSGAAQLRAVSLWGAAAAVGAAAGPLLGGVLVDFTGWQGLFWVDAVVGAGFMASPGATVQESRDPTRSRSIDYAGSALDRPHPRAAHPGPQQGQRLGLVSPATLGCLAVGVAPARFVAVERRVAVPVLDLTLLRNRVLVGSTLRSSSAPAPSTP